MTQLESESSGQKREYKWGNGCTYVGTWSKQWPNRMHGTGTFTWEQSGTEYIGGFKDHKKHGTGVIVYKDGRRYGGDWKNDKRDGEGHF